MKSLFKPNNLCKKQTHPHRKLKKTDTIFKKDPLHEIKNQNTLKKSLLKQTKSE
jgi:hypothetical protein